MINKLATLLFNMSRVEKKVFIILFDLLALFVCLVLAFSMRYGYLYIPKFETDIINIIFSGNKYDLYGLNAFFIISPIVGVTIFFCFGLYQSIIRFINFSYFLKILYAVTTYSIVLGSLMFLLTVEGEPRSVLFINLLVTFILISASRLSVRSLYLNLRRKKSSFSITKEKDKSEENVLIYGAGEAGNQLAQSLVSNSNFCVSGFIDDNLNLENKFINGIKISSSKNISQLIKRKKIAKVIIAIPSISFTRRKEIINSLQILGIEVLLVPSIFKILEGKIVFEDLRKLNINDLLGREPIKRTDNSFQENISDKVVLVTGAGGSIGSELCKQVMSFKPKKIIIFDISEYFLYKINHEIINLNSKNHTGIEIITILGSVANKLLVNSIFKKYNINTVFHSAAYKHVPLLEDNVIEALRNNFIGTENMVEASIDNNVESFILISTDKAVNPKGIMGSTKYLSEQILKANIKNIKNGNYKYNIVRFGNVLGSSGSVVPLFQEQIKRGGPLTVTDKKMMRYFMTISEAVQLVIETHTIAENGDIFILDMGDPVSIYDIAKKMITLSGMTIKDQENPNGDIEIVITGIREGEKLEEELTTGGKLLGTSHPRINKAAHEGLFEGNLDVLKEEINKLIKNQDQIEATRLIREKIMTLD